MSSTIVIWCLTMGPSQSEQEMSMSPDGKRVVILGGTSGIGLATAKAAQRESAVVAVASSRHTRVDRALWSGRNCGTTWPNPIVTPSTETSRKPSGRSCRRARGSRPRLPLSDAARLQHRPSDRGR